MKKLALLFILAAGFLAGCAHTVENYSPSFANISQLQSFKKPGKSITVAQFTATVPNQRAIGCRLEGDERLPGNQTYEQYIQSALQNELQNSGLLSNNSKTMLSGNLDGVTLDSFSGHWIIQMTFNNNLNRPFTVKSDYKFSTNYVADIACEEAAKSFMPAVQQFLNELYANSNFINLLRQ